MISLSSNSVFDSATTRGMSFKLLNSIIEESKSCGEDCYFFEDGQKEKIKIGQFTLKDVKGKDETVEFYIQPKSARPGSAAYMMTKRDNNGTMAVVLMLADEMTFGDFIKKVEDEGFFNDIYSVIGHEVTHLREAEAKQRAYSKEEDDRLENLRNTNKEEYNKQYVNSEVEFESLLTSTISSAEAELISMVSFQSNKREVLEVLDNIESGKTTKSLVMYFMKMFKAMADKFGWDYKKRKKAYSKITPAARYVAENVKDHILKHIIKKKAK